MNLQEIQSIINDINCTVGGIKWTVHCAPMDTGCYVQLRYMEPDIETGELCDQHGRKWYVSSFATKSEIVQTVLKACLTSAEHMVREHFLYKNARVFSPHFDVDLMVKIAATPEFHDVR
jgi:hypothetical protein